MNKNNQPIEDVFNDAFKQFEKAPNPSVWSNIQAGINAPTAGAAGASAAKAAMSIGTKIGLAVATVAVIGTAVYFTTTSEEATTKATAPTENTLPVAENATEEIDADEITITSDAKNAKNDENISTSPAAQQQPINNSKDAKADRQKQTAAPIKDKEDRVEKKSLTAENTNSEVFAEKTEESKSTEKPLSSSTINQTKDKVKADNKRELKEETSTEEVALTAVIQVNTLSGDIPFDLTFGTTQEADSYTWKLNGAVISHNKNSGIIIDQEGTQQLELIVEKDSQTDQSIQIIEGTKPTVVTIPNIFTPNKDGINDVFRIEGDFDQLSIKVLDKNYKELHNWTGQYGFWDGTYPDGSMAPNGVYFYMGTYKKNGNEETLKGSVTLRR